jgi:hypothetical protein
MDNDTMLSEPSEIPCELCGHPVILPDEGAVVEPIPHDQAGGRLRAWHGDCFEEFLDQNEET